MFDWENAKLKIFWKKIDKDGNEIERGVHPKEYKYYGSASKVARYKYPYNEGYRCNITYRDPWQKYTHEAQCDICGTIHTVEQSYSGYDYDSNVYLVEHYDSVERYRKNYNNVCPDCIRKIREFISSMEVGTEEEK